MSFVIGLVVGGCDIPPEQQQRDVCTAFCDCATSGLPSQVEQCVTEQCLPDIGPVSQSCVQCVYENSQQCPVLFDDCADICLDNLSPLLGGMQ